MDNRFQISQKKKHKINKFAIFIYYEFIYSIVLIKMSLQQQRAFL